MSVTPRLIALVGVVLVLVALLGLALFVAVSFAAGESAPGTVYTYGVDGYVWAHGANGSAGGYVGGATVSLQAPCGGCFTSVANTTSAASGYYSITWVVTNPPYPVCSYRIEASAPGYSPGYNASETNPYGKATGCLVSGGTVRADFVGLAALDPLNATAPGGGLLGGSVSSSELFGLLGLVVLVVAAAAFLRYRGQESEVEADVARAAKSANRQSSRAPGRRL